MINDLEHPEGNAIRWDGNSFNTTWDGVGKPIECLFIGRTYADNGG